MSTMTPAPISVTATVTESGAGGVSLSAAPNTASRKEASEARGDELDAHIDPTVRALLAVARTPRLTRPGGGENIVPTPVEGGSPVMRGEE
jgi:hypothetical protein